MKSIYKAWRSDITKVFHFFFPTLIVFGTILEHSTASFDAVIFSERGNTSDFYNKFECPRGNNGADPANIRVFLHIESIREITSEAKLDFYLVQNWNDSRLGRFQQQVKITGRVLPDNVWYPDTYFLLVRNLIYSQEEQYFVVQKDGWIEYNRKVRLITPCSPEVMLFPFDVVKCTLVLSSFGYIENEVTYSWDPNLPVFIDPVNNNVDHLGFYVLYAKHSAYMMPYGPYNYSAIEANIYLERKYTAFLLQVYTPAALIVILSWSIFWVNIHATPARASLGVTTVLTILTLATKSTSQNEKHVSGKLTALDVYIWACFVFVILAMLEFAISDYANHRKKEKEIERKFVETNLIQFNENEFVVDKNGNETTRPVPKIITCQTNPAQFNHPSSSPELSVTEKLCDNSSYNDRFELLPWQRRFSTLNNHSNHSNQCRNINHQFQNGGANETLFSLETLSQFLDDDHDLTRSESPRKMQFHVCVTDGRYLNNCARIVFPVSFLVFNFFYWVLLFICVRANASTHRPQNYNS